MWNVRIFDRTPRSRCNQVSNNVHATFHQQTRLNVEIADLIATCYLIDIFHLRRVWHYSRKRLKLVRTPLNVYFMAFKSIFSLSLCTYYLGWMSCLISFERRQSSCEERGTSENYKKFLSTVGVEPPNTAPLVFQLVPLNHSATETINDTRLELLQYLFTLRYYKKLCAVCKEIYRKWK